jgi:hypothetical protein
LRVDVRYQGNNDIKLTRFIIFSNTTDANTICTATPPPLPPPEVIINDEFVFDSAGAPSSNESGFLVDETISMSRKLF